MDYRRLGRTDLDVSVICLGTMTWGEQNTEAEGHAQMDYAVEQGVNFFDTAELYAIPPRPETQGATERIIGSWLKARGNRDKIILASKVCGRGGNTWFRDDQSPTRLTRKQINEAVEKSLKRLQTDYIDLYQIHFPERPMPWGSNPTRFGAAAYQKAEDETSIPEQLDAFGELVKAGKIRHLGLSNESAWGTMRFVTDSEQRGTPRAQSIQNAYNLLNRTFETNLAEIALHEQVGLLAYSPLAQGYLTGKYLDGARPAGARTSLFNRGQRYEGPGAEEATRRYIAIARQAGLDPAQMALAFVNSRPFVTASIIGATSMEQLRTDIASIDVKLPADVEAQIDAVHQLVGNPCP
ncbi:NADP(H)-dependent aldo-keto reductase [Bosea sp. (in: a-proteobacteria)]|uniref:NADP(H)-dependent aldo-keto reductase n=1 Tax=Bosea sp. (in: a-proteobacteria) TaxID=1871050 RepID=UPI0011F6057C|nr:NADP(H)-dependent aldo-keto reductase [Bosea sp. (in: a-proteobacteria)]TAJ28176.1 MAG: NADP(H)-dependent aldo-keto reductase [Bosea sp. (in: a-proteobacteria)]